VSGITGAPGQGEFYLTRYPTQGGNFETIVLAPNSAQECMAMTVEAFYLAERFRMPVTVLADQLITDGFEDITVPENDAEMKELGSGCGPGKFTRVLTSTRHRRDRHSARCAGSQYRRSLLGLDAHREGYDIEEVRPITSTRIGSFTRSAITGIFSSTTMTRNLWTTILI